jgi:solute:Na+ symporter, SSS family
LPPVLAGLVLAAALAAVMSTSSGALIATATVFSQDIVAKRLKRDIEAGSEHDHIRNNRLYVAGFGILMVGIACVLQDVVGGLLVPILGGSFGVEGPTSALWRRWLSARWRPWSRCSPPTSSPTSRSTSARCRDWWCLATKPTDPEVLAEWDRRSRGQDTATLPAAAGS